MAQINREKLLNLFSDITYDTEGIEGLVKPSASEDIINRIIKIDDEPLTKVQFNQILSLSLAGGISDDFFKYYWLSCPENHTYNLKSVECFSESFCKQRAEESIISLDHLKWGLLRIFIDSLLYFGNIKFGFRYLSRKTKSELNDFFSSKRIKTEEIINRGNTLKFNNITKDDRYLIAETACKTFSDNSNSDTDMKHYLLTQYKKAQEAGQTKIRIKELLSGNFGSRKTEEEQTLPFEFQASEILESEISSEAEIIEQYTKIYDKFNTVRELALKNTEYFLSLVNDLDVYVATSMRKREDFRTMATNCEYIFKKIDKIKSFKLRYFDPTISASSSHEDKGLIECLMVKCAKVLIYSASKSDTYGKDAEASMALSLGKPVIFLCDSEEKKKIFKDIHPLTRLIDFSTGVAVGAIVTDEIDQVGELLWRIFENKMQYKISQSKPGYYKLIEKLTDSVIRIQTDNRLLSKIFWNYYMNK